MRVLLPHGYIPCRSSRSPLISIAWPSTPVSHPHRTVLPSTSREAEVVSSPDEVRADVSSLPPSVAVQQPVISPNVIELDTEHRRPATHDQSEEHALEVKPEPERVSDVFTAVLSETPRLSSGREIIYGSDWTSVVNFAGLIWLVGMAVIAIRLLLAWRYLNQLRANASSLDAQSRLQLWNVSDEVLAAVAAKRLPPLLVSDQLKAPISLGLFRPAIILPREMTQALNASQFRDVLVHEMAHIHRHDHVVVLLQRLTGAFFWPFPLTWRLNAKIDEAREDVCDNYVLRQTEAPKYSRMLLELTERAAPQMVPLAIGLWKSRRKLEQRVTALLDPRRTTGTRLPRLTRCSLAVAFMSIVVLLAGSRIIPNDVLAAESARNAGEKTESANENAEKEVGSDEKQSNPGERQALSVAESASPDHVAKLAKDDRSEPFKGADGVFKDKADPYDTLYEVIMTRWKDGKAYAQDETSPAVFSWSEFPFDDSTFDKFNAALDAFATLPQEKIEKYSDVQRALMQRNLWELFETTFNWKWSADWWWDGQRSFPKTHIERRAIAQPKIASLIKRLALTKEQILALPNTLAATIKSGQFAEAHDPADPLKPFLPRDLHSPTESSWICLAKMGKRSRRISTRATAGTGRCSCSSCVFPEAAPILSNTWSASVNGPISFPWEHSSLSSSNHC